MLCLVKLLYNCFFDDDDDDAGDDATIGVFSTLFNLTPPINNVTMTYNINQDRARRIEEL